MAFRILQIVTVILLVATLILINAARLDDDTLVRLSQCATNRDYYYQYEKKCDIVEFYAPITLIPLWSLVLYLWLLSGKLPSMLINRISKEDESEKVTPFFGCLTAWVLAIPFAVWSLYFIFALFQFHYWYTSYVIEGIVEPFLHHGGLYIGLGVTTIAFIVDSAFTVRAWINERNP